MGTPSGPKALVSTPSPQPGPGGTATESGQQRALYSPKCVPLALITVARGPVWEGRPRLAGTQSRLWGDLGGHGRAGPQMQSHPADLAGRHGQLERGSFFPRRPSNDSITSRLSEGKGAGHPWGTRRKWRWASVRVMPLSPTTCSPVGGL